jgi:hypothetical protein
MAAILNADFNLAEVVGGQDEHAAWSVHTSECAHSLAPSAAAEIG